MSTYITNTFTFPNASQSLVASLRQILDFISGNLPVYADAADINFKLKVIITELLNNALKHTGDAQTTFRVFIDAANIKIDKTDYGKRFNPRNLVPLSGNKTGSKVQLSNDALNNVYALIESEAFMRFVCEENNSDGVTDVNNIIEHFGLLIITRAADEFTYSYDRQTGLNTFAVRLKLT